ncbi:MAG: undecaprenyl-diphosphate phosphatase [Ardenticatenia bacterium]|nr:MAG: undecaprenyl-diphosphate phosphatase [Ardenticatenia bacterium]
MDLVQAIILGIVQGATEFIPISSSGHLVLVPWLFGWDDPGLTYDAIVHWGTLLAVLSFFWRDFWEIARNFLSGLVRGEVWGDQTRLGWLLIVGTLPAAVIGLLLESQFEALFGKPQWVALFLMGTGCLLWLSERWRQSGKTLSDMGVPDALVIGFAQALAITPGISRSGSTIAAGLLRGLDRATAARFSFLLMAPIVFGAGAKKTLDLLSAGVDSATLLPVGLGFLAAALTGYVSIGFLMRYLQRATLHLFAYWCWGFGFFCFVLALWRGG